MAGTTDPTYRARLNFSGSTGSFTANIAATNATAFTQALFVPGWQSNSVLSGRARGEQQNNAGRIENWIITYKSGDPADKQVYKYWTTIESEQVQQASSTSALVDVTVTEHNNSAQNRIGLQYHPVEVSQNGNRYLSHIQLAAVGGTWKIANYDAEGAPSQ